MSKTEQPRISIISPSFNQASFIDQTIQSVLAQNYRNFEHIVIDGGSTDGTVELLKKYPHLIWRSERDRGQADALNKGLRLATGDIVGWINSDDYFESGIFTDVAACFQDMETQWVIGNLQYHFEDTGELVPDQSLPVTHQTLLRDPDRVRQQPTFFRRVALERVGGWNADFHMVMDFDLWLRLARMSPPKMVDATWAYFRMHGMQKTTFANNRRQTKEIICLLRRDGAPLSSIAKVYLRKHLYLLKGYVKSRLIDFGLVDAKYTGRPMRLKTR